MLVLMLTPIMKVYWCLTSKRLKTFGATGACAVLHGLLRSGCREDQELVRSDVSAKARIKL